MTASPFIALWMLVSIFAGIFGLWGSLPIFIVICIFISSEYINGNFSALTIVYSVIIGIIPLVISNILCQSWLNKNIKNGGNRTYQNLASELSEVANKSEVVINAIGDGVIAIDNQGIIRLINPAAQEMIGWGKQDALSLNYKSVLKLVNQKDEALSADNDPIQQVLNNNQQIRVNNLSVVTSSEKKIMVSLVISPVGDAGSGVITVFRDITKEKSEEREQAEFISTASHEMRTPVASIEGYLGLALNSQTAQIDDRARNYVLKAHESAEHLGQLFQDLLDVTKSDDGRLINNPKLTNIVNFVHDIVQGLQPKANEKELQLIYKPIPNKTIQKLITPSYYVNLDNGHIREIINNLVENAIKYTVKGEVVVDVNGDNEHITISVKDSGIGIPAEDIPHLFQKFYRVDNKDTREIGGTGLGLYLSRRLAEIMGGRVWAESTYGKGSTFYFELPRVSGQELEQVKEQTANKAREESIQKEALNTNVSPAINAMPEKTIQTIPTSNMAPTQTKTISNPTISPVINSVPRNQPLTPKQISEYVSRQRTLAQQQAEPQLSRPRSINVPNRSSQK